MPKSPSLVLFLKLAWMECAPFLWDRYIKAASVSGSFFCCFSFWFCPFTSELELIYLLNLDSKTWAGLWDCNLTMLWIRVGKQIRKELTDDFVKNGFPLLLFKLFLFFLREIFGIVSFSVMFMMNSCKRFSYNVFSFFNLGAMALQMECLLVTL